jgi:hypothetical protein
LLISNFSWDVSLGCFGLIKLRFVILEEHFGYYAQHRLCDEESQDYAKASIREGRPVILRIIFLTEFANKATIPFLLSFLLILISGFLKGLNSKVNDDF